MSQERRSARVSGDIAEVLSELIRVGVKDPRVGPLTITSVRMSADLKIAHVNFASLGGKGDPEAILQGLRSATGWLRKELGLKMRMRHTPELRFHPDDSIDRGFEMTQLLDQIGAQRTEGESSTEE